MRKSGYQEIRGPGGHDSILLTIGAIHRTLPADDFYRIGDS